MPSSGFPRRSASTGALEREKERRDADDVGPRVPRHVLAPTLPSRADVAPSGGRVTASEAATVDPVPGETEERGEQRDRRDHHDEDDGRGGDAAGGHERDAGDRETEDRDDDRAAREDHRLTGGGDGAADRLFDR